MSADRREFLGSMLGLALAGRTVGTVGTDGQGVVGGLSSRSSSSSQSSPTDSPFDVSWADKLTGKHRAVFDSVEISMGLGLLRALLWQKDYAEVYQAPPADMNGVMVLRHNAIWIIMDDEFWAHHDIGTMTKITDPKTKAPIKRNPFLGPNVIGMPPAMADDSLKKVLASCTVLACNLAFTLDVVEKVKADLKLDDAKAREAALKHVLPGVILQPSGVFATLRAQEAGCHYLLATGAA